MYSIKADVAKNRLYVTIQGFLEDKEMKACTDMTISESKKLKPGFDVITDISQFKPAGPETTKEIERGQAYFKASKIGRGIRVVGQSSLSSMQFKRTGKTVGYEPDTVATIAEAEELLDSPA
jgi:hypothetical protein